ncbi:unnamed protein product, partial [Urochloa humidicola]
GPGPVLCRFRNQKNRLQRRPVPLPPFSRAVVSSPKFRGRLLLRQIAAFPLATTSLSPSSPPPRRRRVLHPRRPITHPSSPPLQPRPFSTARRARPLRQHRPHFPLRLPSWRPPAGTLHAPRRRPWRAPDLLNHLQDMCHAWCMKTMCYANDGCKLAVILSPVPARGGNPFGFVWSTDTTPSAAAIQRGPRNPL